MSGSSYSGSLISDDEIACEDLKFHTQIASPVPAAVAVLNVGVVLDVRVVNNGVAQQVQVYNGIHLVGGLLANQVPRLRECILKGSAFKATVLSIDGGQVRISVRHA